jgi:hypothetical protein
MPIVSYPSSHSGWHTSPGESVSLPSQLPALPFSGNVTMHCEGSTGTHVAGVNSPSAEHEDVITPDNSNVSRHPGVHDVPAASVVTSLQPPAANFFVPSLPFSGFVTAHMMSFTQVAAVKTPSAEHEDVEPSFSEYPSLHAGVHDAPGASVFTFLQLLPPVPAVPLPGFVTAHVMSFTQVAAVKTPSAEHEDVEPSFSEYPVLHAGVHDAPAASVVTPWQPPAFLFVVPALPFSGFDTSHVMSAVSCLHVESVTSPAAEQFVSPDSVYPISHSGVHDLPAASVPSLQLFPPFPGVGLPVPVAKDTVQSCTHVAAVSVPAEHVVVVCPSIVDSEYPASQSGTHDPSWASLLSLSTTFLQLSLPVPSVPLAGFAYSHAFPTHVARVRVPAVHDVVSCPESEYPELHTGSQLSPDASSVSPSHVPAAALSGFVSFSYVAAVHASAVQTPPVIIPFAHENSADNEYPELHVGVHVVPCSSWPALAASLQPPSVPSVGVV